jgi:prepilin-type N-terminal cleavage/methylation domain-containing protein
MLIGRQLRRPRSAPGGFTLAEVLIALVLIAALAAVVVPTIGSQMGRADPGRLARDASAIRGAVNQFASDVGQYPGSVTQLVTKIVDGVSAGPIYGVYGVSERDRWKGPYLTKDATAVLQTGFERNFDPTLRVDTLGISGLSETVTTNPRYLTLCVAIDSASALVVDKQYDDGVLTTGTFRWTVNTASANDTLKFLLVPIQ